MTMYLCHGGVCDSCIRCLWPPPTLKSPTPPLGTVTFAFLPITGGCAVLGCSFSVGASLLVLTPLRIQTQMYATGAHIRYDSCSMGARLLATVIGPSPSRLDFPHIQY